MVEKPLLAIFKSPATCSCDRACSAYKRENSAPVSSSSPFARVSNLISSELREPLRRKAVRAANLVKALVADIAENGSILINVLMCDVLIYRKRRPAGESESDFPFVLGSGLEAVYL